MGSFWLRCRTAVFEDRYLADESLFQDPNWWSLLSDRPQIKSSESVNWHSIDKVKQSPLSTKNGFKIDFRSYYSVKEIELFINSEDLISRVSVFSDGIEPVEYDVREESDKQKIVLHYAGKIIQESTISFDGFESPVQLVDINVIGFDQNKNRLFSKPNTYVSDKPYVFLLYLWNTILLTTLVLSGTYGISKSIFSYHDLLIAIRTVIVASVILITVLFLYRGYQELTYIGFEYSRVVVLMSVVLTAFLLILNRLVINGLHRRFLRRGVGIRDVLIIGDIKEAIRVTNQLDKHYWMALSPAGFISTDNSKMTEADDRLPFLGGINQLIEIAEKNNVKDIVIALPDSAGEIGREIIRICSSNGLQCHVVSVLFEAVSTDLRKGVVSNVEILDLDDRYLGEWDRWIKRALDIVSCVFCIIVLSIPLIVLSLLIKLTSRGPIFFSQLRVGESARAFSCLKFRSMYTISEDQERKERVEQYQSHIKGTSKTGKIVNRNRVTRLGKVMRKYRLDELPQIYNVLKGEMSWVGPRPPIPYEVEDYSDSHMERFKCKPGITGLWQVSGGPDLTFEEMVNLDINYLKNWSLWLDLKIIAKTIPVVIMGKGS